MAARLMHSLFASKCAKCGGRIDKGAEIYYSKSLPKGARTTHAACGEPSAAPAPAAQPEAPQPQQHHATPAPEGRVWRMHHDSVQAFCNLPIAARNAYEWRRYGAEYESDTAGRRSKWLAGSAGNVAGVTRRLRDGWPEGAAKITELSTGPLVPPRSTRRVRRWADNGDTVEMSRVWAGRVDVAWQRCHRDQRNAPAVVRIVPMISGSCLLEESQFFYRGAAVARLADALTEAGYNVEIIAACVAQRFGDRGQPTQKDYCHTLTLKGATAPLDLSNLAAVLCQPGFIRWYLFKSFAACEHATIDQGMGWYGDEPALDRMARAAVEADNTRTVFMRYSIDTESAAQQWLAESIAAIQGDDVAQAA